MIIAAHNPETDTLEKTYLSSLVSADDTVLAVKNSDNFAAGDRVLVGEMGGENSEIRSVTAVDANETGITVDALDFDHNADTPIYRLEYDKIRFYRRTDINGAPILMTTLDIDVDNEEKVTRWDDTTSASTYFYQTAFYNSVDLEESDLSDPIQATGYDPDTIGSIVDEVVRRVRDTGYTVLSFDEYLDVANEVGQDLMTQAQKPYRFTRRTVTLNTVAGQNYIDLPADLWKFERVTVGLVTGGTTSFKPRTPLTEQSFMQRYDNSQYAAQDNIQDVALDDDNTRLWIHPTPKTSQTGVIKLTYFKRISRLTKAGDVIETPNTLLYRYKLMAEFYSAKSESDNQWVRLADKYENKYGNEVVKLQRTNRLDVGTPQSMRPKRMYRRRRYYL